MPLPLSTLTKFNPALVYAFEPESSSEHLMVESASEIVLENSLYRSVWQHVDMFEAYHYLQEVLLPLFRREGEERITPETLVGHIKAIHGKVAKTLCQMIGGDEDTAIRSGEFTNCQIFRWHFGTQMSYHLARYLSGMMPSSLTIDDFVEEYTPEGMQQELFLAFIGLMERLRDDDTITVDPLEPALQRTGDDEPGYRVLRAYNKLGYNRQNNRFDANETALIDRVVKIPMHASRFASSMLEYAKRILDAYYSVNADDLDAVAYLLSEAFYGLTEIHPFANGNGRTATCLINLMSRALGGPSFMMRLPGEKSNPSSSYAKAIEQIDLNRDLLSQHIRSCLERANKEGWYSNPTKEAVLHARIEWVEILDAIKSSYPGFDVNAHYHKLREKFNNSQWAAEASRSMDKDEFALLVVNKMKEAYSQKLEELNHQAGKAPVSWLQPGFFSIKPKTASVKSLLKQLTNLDDPVVKKLNGEELFLFKFKNVAERDMAFNALKGESSFSVKKRSDKKTYYLSVEAVDAKALEAAVARKTSQISGLDL